MQTTDSSPSTATDQNVLAAVAYLGFFVTGILLLLVEKRNDYVRFHAMQSTVASLAFIVVTMALSTMSGYFGLLSPLLALAVTAANFIGLIVWIMLLWKSFNGEKYLLPYIGEFAERQLKSLFK